MTADFAHLPKSGAALKRVRTLLVSGRSRLFPAVSGPTVRQRRTKKGQVVPMGTIIARKRADGSTGYTAQILKKKGGEIIFREAKTFDRKQAAKAWLERRETELRLPGAMERKEDPPLRDVIDRYINETKRKLGRTKEQVLRTIKANDIADMRCSKIGSSDWVAFAQSLKVQPQTSATSVRSYRSPDQHGAIRWTSRR
jgi:hypothetical protein